MGNTYLKSARNLAAFVELGAPPCSGERKSTRYMLNIPIEAIGGVEPGDIL